MAQGPQRGRTMEKDLGKMTPEGSHMRNRRSDLRGLGSTPTSRPQRGRTATGVPIRLLDFVRPLWGRMSVEMSSTAGQDLRLSTWDPFGVIHQVVLWHQIYYFTKKKRVLFCSTLDFSSLGDVRRRFRSAAEKELCDKNREVTPSRHKKETSFFCSALDFS